MNPHKTYPLAPGIFAGAALGVSDVLTKIVIGSGADVLTVLSFRSIVGIAFVASWLCFGPKPQADRRVRLISLGIGVLFSGLIFCLFKAIAAIDVSTAVLSYFTYPLLTGIAASIFGLEPLRWRGLLCAVAAFCGLAIMLGAHPAGLAFAGVAYAIGAGCCRTGVLLITRAYLVGADARLTTWYSMLSSTAVFIAVSVEQQNWNAPQTSLGWICSGGDEFRDNGIDPLRLCIDASHRTVPDRTDHEFRAIDRDYSQRTRARPGDHTDPRARQRHHAGGTGRVPIVALTLCGFRIRTILRRAVKNRTRTPREEIDG